MLNTFIAFCLAFNSTAFLYMSAGWGNMVYTRPNIMENYWTRFYVGYVTFSIVATVFLFNVFALFWFLNLSLGFSIPTPW